MLIRKDKMTTSLKQETVKKRRKRQYFKSKTPITVEPPETKNQVSNDELYLQDYSDVSEII